MVYPALNLYDHMNEYSDQSKLVRGATQPKSVSLVIPIYNEADHLERFLSQIDLLELPLSKELVFVDDCSTDKSLAILKHFDFVSNVKIIAGEVNQGKGSALRL